MSGGSGEEQDKSEEKEGREVVLPAELLTLIIKKVIDDPEVFQDPSTALARMEAVNRLWRDVAVGFYRDLCLRRRALRRPHLDPVYAWQNFDTEVRHDAMKCKQFYKKVMRTHAAVCQGRGADAASVFSVDVWKGVESENQRHQDRSITDMLYSRESGKMVISVGSDVQVWDVNSLRRINLFKPHQIDVGRVRGTCFAVSQCGKFLIFGTESSKLRVFDIMSCNLLKTYTVSQGEDNSRIYICDIKAFGDHLWVVDWEGVITQWKVKGSELAHVKAIIPPLVPDTDEVSDIRSFNNKHHEYRDRFRCRILDCNNELIATTARGGWLCVVSAVNPKSVTFEQSMAMKEVEAMRLSGDVIYCGLQCGVLQKVSMRKHGLHSGYYVNATPTSCKLSKQFTELSDTITSLDVSRDGEVVAVGDINGEINVYLTDDNLFGKRQAARLFRSDRGHTVGVTLWSVQMDDARIFSGDSDGRLVVHDLWNRSEDTSQPSSLKGRQQLFSTSPVHSFKRLKFK